MSALASLTRAYERMKDAPPFGFARVNVSFAIRIGADGQPVCDPIDLRRPAANGKKLVGRRLELPTYLVQRTSGPKPNFLWDKTSYALGIAKSDPSATASKRAKEIENAAELHRLFVDLHREHLTGATDEGLKALLLFLENWTPEQFDGWSDEARGENIVFQLDGDSDRFIHEREAARRLWLEVLRDEPASDSVCLVTGEKTRTVLSHPPIKGVAGAQSSGAFIVSFNSSAYESYGHAQGSNAPVSETTAFAYTTALNRFLETDSGHRIHIGDASTVFWADACDADASAAEGMFEALLSEVDETAEAKKIAAILDAVRQGRPLDTLTPSLPNGVRFFILALSPNAARLSVRFYIEDDFGVIAKRYLEHVERMRIEPGPRESAPSIWRFLIETAAQRKSENIPPLLAGEWLRAILTGARYPQMLLSAVLTRMRADHDVNPYRVAMIRAVLVRNFQWEREAPVALDPQNENPAYLLGRLFAVLEKTQNLALGSVNASIKDRYYGSASATPRSVFPLLLRMNVHHQSKASSKSKGLAGYFAGQLSEIMNKFPAEFPPTLSLQSQGAFALGYFHQMNRRGSTGTDVTAASEE
jgi:CRISPR-associated protein Csd1